MFTQVGDQELETFIDQELLGIAAYLAEHLTGLAALVLTGGFGRGEGSSVQTPSGLRPYNDYDLVAVFDGGFDRQSVRRIATIIEATVSVPFLDLVPMRRQDLSKLPATMFNYDLTHGSQVIWGQKGILDELPSFKAEDLPPAEAKRLLVNRLVTFLESAAGDQPRLNDERREFVAKQTAKVALACVDSKLLLNKLYATQYREKIELFSTLSDSEDERTLADLAYSVKVFPHVEVPSVQDFWVSTADMYLECLGELFQASEPNPSRRLDIAGGFVRDELRGVFGRRGLKLFRARKKLFLRVAQLLIAQNFRRRDRRQLRLAARLLSWIKHRPGGSTWDHLRETAVVAWYAICR